jgi:type IV secretion system protein VirB11
MTNRDNSQSYLDLYLAPLTNFLQRPNVTDIFVNQPGEVWIELLGGGLERSDVPDLDEAFLWRLARQVANVSHQGVSRRHPLLSAALPDGSRIQIVTPPATRANMAIAIRRHTASSLPLATYSRQDRDQPLDDSVGPLTQSLDPADYPNFLAQAVRRRLNIVISGGTSAGKTTLLNSLLAEIPQNERLISIEDAPELFLAHPNSVGLVSVRGDEGEARVTPEELLQAALRMRPDRIILGELRGAEAFTFLRAINTGHPGSLTTIHADTPARALVQLAMMALQAGLGIAYADLHALVSEMVDVVVQVERHAGARRIASILAPRLV